MNKINPTDNLNLARFSLHRFVDIVIVREYFFISLEYNHIIKNQKKKNPIEYDK